MKVTQLFGAPVKRRKDFSDIGSLPTSKLLERLSFLARPKHGGLNKFDPLCRVEQQLRSSFFDAFSSVEYQHLDIPVLQQQRLWGDSGRWQDFGDDIFTTADDQVLCPTTEEPLVDLLGLDKNLSYRELPRVVIGERTLFRRTSSNSYRRPPEFHLLDVYSFHEEAGDVAEFVESTAVPSFTSLFDAFGLDVVPVRKREGYVDYKYLTDEGDDTAFLTDDGEGYHEPDDATADVRPASCLSLGVTMDLGDRYPREMGVEYVREDGSSRHPHVGNYGVGLERLAYAVIDANRTEVGNYHTIDWPATLHPYSFGIVGIPGDEYADRLYERVGGRDVLFDDTDDSVGTKIARMYALGVEEFAVVGDRERDADVLEVERTSDGSSEERTLDALSGA